MRQNQASASGPSGLPPTNPPVTRASAADLVERRNGLEQRVRELAKERHKHAFVWAAGDQKAWSKIEAIDKERNKLNAQIEALGQAVNVQQAQERERKQTDDLDQRRIEFNRNRGGLARSLTRQVHARYVSLARHLQVLKNQGCHHEANVHFKGNASSLSPDDPYALPGAVNIPKVVALELIAPLCRCRKATPSPHDPRITHYVEGIDQSLADEFVAALIGDAKLPEIPTDAGEFVRKYAGG